MAENKTKQNDASVLEFIHKQMDEARRQDCFTLLEILQATSGQVPKMWGESIIGFGARHYRYASGHEGDTCLLGFSPRKQNLVLYMATGTEGFSGAAEILSRLGRFKTGVGCLYIKKITDIDQAVLKELLEWSLKLQT